MAHTKISAEITEWSWHVMHMHSHRTQGKNIAQVHFLGYNMGIHSIHKIDVITSSKSDGGGGLHFWMTNCHRALPWEWGRKLNCFVYKSKLYLCQRQQLWQNDKAMFKSCRIFVKLLIEIFRINISYGLIYFIAYHKPISMWIFGLATPSTRMSIPTHFKLY